MAGCDKVNRLAQHFVVVTVDDVRFVFLGRIIRDFPECVDIDDHDLNVAGNSKIPHLIQLAGIVDEVIERRVVVLRFEVIAHQVEGTFYAFLDGNARHHNNEFRPAVEPVQLENRPQINVGLTRPRLHPDTEIHRLGYRLRRLFQSVSKLNRMDIVQNLFRQELKLIGIPKRVFSEVEFVLQLANREVALTDLLSQENVGDRLDRILLESQIGVEFKFFHGLTPFRARGLTKRTGGLTKQVSFPADLSSKGLTKRISHLLQGLTRSYMSYDDKIDC